MKATQSLLYPVIVLGSLFAESTLAAEAEGKLDHGNIRATTNSNIRRRNLESWCPGEKYPNYYSLKVDGTTHYMLGRPGNFGNVETSDNLSIWEEWYLIRNCDGSTSFQSKKHNTFISASASSGVIAADIGSNNNINDDDNDYGVKLIKDGNDESTKFDITVKAQNKETGNLIVTIQSRAHGTYLSAMYGRIVQVGTPSLYSGNEYWEIDDLVEDKQTNFDIYPACAGNTFPTFDPYNTYFSIMVNALFITSDDKHEVFYLSGDWGKNVKLVNYVSDWEEWYLIPSCVSGTYAIKSKQHNTYLSVGYEGEVDLTEFNGDSTRFFIHADDVDDNVIELESVWVRTYVNADPNLNVNAENFAGSDSKVFSWQVFVISDTE